MAVARKAILSALQGQGLRLQTVLPPAIFKSFKRQPVLQGPSQTPDRVALMQIQPAHSGMTNSDSIG